MIHWINHNIEYVNNKGICLHFNWHFVFNVKKHSIIETICFFICKFESLIYLPNEWLRWWFRWWWLWWLSSIAVTVESICIVLLTFDVDLFLLFLLFLAYIEVRHSMVNRWWWWWWWWSWLKFDNCLIWLDLTVKLEIKLCY